MFALARSAPALVLVAPALSLAQGGTPPANPAPVPSATAVMPPQPAPPPGPAPTAPPPGPAPTAPPPQAYPPPSYPPASYPPPGGYPPPQQYPPGYGYGYPPPGYYYPPPGYGWGAPARPPRPEYPEDAAGQTTPYLDMLMAGIAVDKRYDHLFTVGVQGGVYLASRVRIVGRVLLFTTEPDDDLGDDYYSNEVLPAGYTPKSSDRPALVFGGAVGVAPVVRRNFVFAPGIGFHTTNVGAYGSMLTLAMPFEWVTDDGARFGFEVDIGRAFGGRVTGICAGGACTTGEERDFDRPSAPAFLAAFELGWGFNHPKAKLPQSPTVP